MQERRSLDAIEDYYQGAANGQAQIVFFSGMFFAAALLAVIAYAIGGDVKITLLAGALGAVMSVLQRISARHLNLEYDVGRPFAFFLGALRPMIGGGFAVAIGFAFTSGFLTLPLRPEHTLSKEQFALAVIAFLAGFSERFVKDTLGAVAQTAVPSTVTTAEGPTRNE